MRWKGKLKLGWFPLPLAEAERIRKFLVFPAASFPARGPLHWRGRGFRRHHRRSDHPAGTHLSASSAVTRNVERVAS